MYEYVLKNHNQIDCIWLSKNKFIIKKLKSEGKKSYHSWSLQGLWFSFRAGYSFICCSYEDVNRIGIVSSIKVQFWHGIPMKKIRYDFPKTPSKDSLGLISKLFFNFFPFYDENFDFVISTGQICSNRFKSAFNISTEKLLETGSPRTDILLSKNSEQSINSTILLTNDSKFILYAPTHRNEGKKIFDYLNGFDEKQWNQISMKYNIKLIISLHYYERDNKKRLLKKFRDSNTIHILDDIHDDINKYLNTFYLLITDYSSIWYDFLILDRPIIYLAPDLDEYVVRDRAHYNEFSDEVVGPITLSWDETFDEIQKTFIENNNDWNLLRNNKISKYYSYIDGNSSKRLMKFILENE